MLIYDLRDKSGADELRTHMASMEKAGLVQVLDRNTTPGSDLSMVDKLLLSRGNLFLFLLSANSAEDPLIESAMKRARTIPILYRPMDWENSGLNRLAPLPKSLKFITLSRDRDEEWMKIVQEIRALAKLSRTNNAPPPAMTRKLSEHMLQAVHEAIVSARIDRVALMSSLSNDLVYSLSIADSPSSQHWSDLNQLNNMGQCSDGSSPMDSYLRTAIRLAGPRRERTVFEEALAALRR